MFKMTALKREKYYIFKDKNSDPILFTVEALIDILKKYNEQYKKKGAEYPLTIMSVLKILSNLLPEESAENVNVKFVNEYDTGEEAKKAGEEISKLVHKKRNNYQN